MKTAKPKTDEIRYGYESCLWKIFWRKERSIYEYEGHSKANYRCPQRYIT